MNDREPPAALPEPFLARHRGIGFSDGAFMDGPAIIDGPTKGHAWKAVRNEVESLKRLVFPRHGI
jgi:hypothetical protein